jgi:hypothetical protein
MNMLRYRKKFKIGNLKSLIDLNCGKYGPYGYVGAKDKNGISAGYSIGTRGQYGYGSYNKKRWQARIKYNIETGSFSPRIKKYPFRNKRRTRK